MKKTYILDTNVLISDPNCFHSFDDNDLIVPLLVLEELDKHKGRSDEVGRNCRDVSRRLNEYSKIGSLKDGIKMPGGGLLKVLQSFPEISDLIPPDLSHGSSVDNMIVGFAIWKHREDKNTILVSKDINIRLKCSSLGIDAQDYLSLRVADNLDMLYSGVSVVQVETGTVDGFYSGDTIKAADITADKVYPNQILVIKSVDIEGNTIKSALTRMTNDGTLCHLKKFDSIFGIRPRNKEQTFSLDLLMDPSIKLVTLTGRAGSGKTLIALAAGLEQLEAIGSQKIYKKLIVSRPIQPVGRDIGFLPGTMAEKMEPWISPIRDNLEFLLGSSQLGKKAHTSRRKNNTDDTERSGGFKDPYLDLMQQKGLIEVEAMAFIRGRSIPNSFMIIDEAQNLTMHELKTIVTRAGEDTKIVLTGDIEQIDNVHVDTFTNGLTYAIEKFKKYDLSGHITLIKGERSALATLASQIL